MKTMIRAVSVGAAAVLVAGCASVSDGPKTVAKTAALDTASVAVPKVGQERYQFAPLPPAEISAQDLGPNSDRPPAENLREAETEFKAAADARARGDEEGAYQHYSEMMERLLDANVDPSTFFREHEQVEETPGAKAPVLDSQLEASAQLNSRVQAEIEAIQQVYPKSFQAGLDRSFRYLPYVRQKFAAAGLPEDLVWLAMVESQFTPKIDSRAGAGGMWQFIRGTGRRYGLRSDWYVDDRYDWRLSTDAAIGYLSELYEMFDGNWPLAITAYNMGEGGLERAIDSAGGEDDLWQLLDARTATRRIKQESRRYYAKLLATILVAKNPEQYGFQRNPQAPEDCETIHVKGFFALADIEKKAGLERGVLAALNPQLVRGYTPPARETLLAVPAPTNDRVTVALASMPELHPGTHVVRRGETLAKIASIYGVPAKEIQTANRISSAKALKAGQQLVIPGGVKLGQQKEVMLASAPARTYTVRNGDSLSEIANKHSVSVKDLQKWNKLGSATDIRAGQKLVVTSAPVAPVRQAEVVATSAPRAKSPAMEAVYHTVKKGEFADKIAKSYGVNLDDLLAWNGMTKKSTLQPGQKLKIMTAAKTTEPTHSDRIASAPAAKYFAKNTHVVGRGETATLIAKKYDVALADLLGWNNLTAKSVLKVGDKLVVRQAAANTTSGKRPAHVASSADSGTVRHVHSVAVGEGLNEIADEFDVSVNTLMQWNGWSEAPKLGKGDEVVVYQPAPAQD